MNKKKSLFGVLFLCNLMVVTAIFVVFTFVLANCKKKSDTDLLLVSIVQYIDHPALDSCRTGFMQEMIAMDYKEEINIVYDYQNAQGDPNIAYSIAEKVVSSKPSVIFSLATPMTQTIKRITRNKEIPIVFGAITDPVSAGLVDSMLKPGNNITGTSDRWPYREQLELLIEVFPDAHRVGVIFNPGEDNTRYAMEKTREAAKAIGLELIEAPVSTGAEISEAAQSIVARCDAFYIPADNTAMAGAGSIIKIASSRMIPVIAGDPETFKLGCVVGLGVSYKELGVKSARMVDKIIKGASAGDMPVFASSSGSLMVNLFVAQSLGVEIPKSVIERADIVVSKNELDR